MDLRVNLELIMRQENTKVKANVPPKGASKIVQISPPLTMQKGKVRLVKKKIERKEVA